MKHYPLVVAAAGLATALPALAQHRHLILDRTAGAQTVWAVDDFDASQTIQEPGELSVYFDASNQAGTISLSTPAALAVRADGTVAVGDASLRAVFLLRDTNRSNDAQGFGESWVAADAANDSGVQFNAPNGIAWDSDGALYISNAGATGTQDAIYRLIDLDADGRYQSEGEITEFVGQPYFGVGNGPRVPAAIALNLAAAPFIGYVRDSSAGTPGVYRFRDDNANQRADDAGETTLFFGPGNLSAVTVAAGLTLALDPLIPNTVYFTQISAGARQLIRAGDLNGNGNAQDPGEAAVVWSTTDSLSILDVIALPDGRVMMSDASSGNKRIILLTDDNNNGHFEDPEERTVYYAATAPGGVRQLAGLPRYCQGNCDNSALEPVLNVADFTCFLQHFAAGDPYANCDGSSTAPVLNVGDFTCFLQVFADGCR